MKLFVEINTINKLFFFFGLFIVNFAFPQNSYNSKSQNFYYKLVYKPDTLSEQRFEEHFILTIANGKSLFTDVVNKKADSMETNLREYYRKNPSATYSFKGVPRARFSYYVEKDLVREQVIHYYDKIGAKHFMYKENPDLKWKLYDDIKVIGGNVCQKASVYIYGRSFTAWFAKDIPINDGPYKFYNLPGLILEVYDEQKDYHFSLIHFNPNAEQDSAIVIPSYRLNKLTDTEKEKFIKGKYSYDISIIDRLKNSMIGDSLTPERINDIRERLKRNNNPLELKP